MPDAPSESADARRRPIRLSRIVGYSVALFGVLLGVVLSSRVIVTAALAAAVVAIVGGRIYVLRRYPSNR